MTIDQDGDWRQVVTSPRIEALRREIEEEPHAINEFWASVAESGAPLVEEIPGDHGAARVTFIYRDWTGDLNHVTLGVGMIANDFADNRLMRVGDSDLLALSLRVPADTRAEYSLCPNGPLTPLFDQNSPAGHSDQTRHEFIETEGRAQWEEAVVTTDPLNSKTVVLPFNEWTPNSYPPFSLLELRRSPLTLWSRSSGADEPFPSLYHLIDESTRGGPRRLWFQSVGDAPPQRLLVVLDGWEFIHGKRTALVLERLHRAGLVPPVGVVFVDSGTRAMRVRDYLGSRVHSEYLADEIVPMAAEHFDMAPVAWATTIYGMSGGGLTALATGFRRPEVFGNVMALGTPAMLAIQDELPDGLIGLARRIAPDLRPRVHLQAGRLEIDRIAGSSVLGSNRDLCSQLGAMAFDVILDEVSCGHGVTDFNESSVKGLLRLLGMGQVRVSR